MVDALLATGALLGTLAFGWDAWSYLNDRKRRQWADDLRVVLIAVQGAMSEVRTKPRTPEWAEKNLRELITELNSVHERMPNGHLRQLVKALEFQIIGCDLSARSMARDQPVEAALAAGKQADEAEKAHALALRLLRKV